MDQSLRRTPPLVVIAGPTGSGKSGLALKIAQRFGGEILNCDSVQVYRHFNIGTAKTPPPERAGIPHHLIDALNPDEIFTAGDFSRAGREIMREMAGRGSLPVVTGGTGFYIRALIDGLAPCPRRDPDLRARLAERERKQPGSLYRLLRRLDTVTAERIHPNDVPKTMRAVEICIASRRPAAAVFEAGRDVLRGFEVLKVGLFPDRELLYQRLEARLERMFAQGLVDETASILAMGYPETAKPFESIGYKQALQVVKGELSIKDALFYARRDTRRYAKRQMTWFRQEPGLQVIRGFGDDAAVMERALGLVADLVNQSC